jgi:hypothetical protein
MRPTLIVIGSVLSMLCGAYAAPASAEPTLSVVGKDTVEVKAKDKQDTATAQLVVLNAGKADAPLDVQLQAASSKLPSISGVKPDKLAAGKATRVAVTLAGLKDLKKDKVDGQLVIADPDGTPVAQALSITPAPHPARDWPTWIFYRVLVALGVLFVIGALAGLESKTLFRPATAPKWGFDSWATTLTAIGGVFGTVLGAATLPAVPSQIDKDTLISLNLLYGTMVVVAPLAFQALRNPFASATDQEAGFTGWNVTLLLSCSITAAAVLGELAALGLLGWELTNGGKWGDAIRFGVIVLGVLAAIYFLVTVCQLVRTDWKARGEEAKAAAAQRTFDLTIVTGLGDQQRIRGYRLLLDDVKRVAEAEAAQEAKAAPGGAPIGVPVPSPEFATSWKLL